jgi:hypothetical protein
MSEARLTLPTVLFLLAIVAAAAFAAGRSTAPPIVSASAAAPASPPPPPLAREDDDQLPPGHPPTQGDLPVGHPPVAASGAGMSAPMGAPSSDDALEWKVPSRWESVPNASSMRLATYRVPRAAGDSEDGDVSVTQVGGSVEANADRWIGQFDDAGQKTAKKTTRKVGAFEVTMVEVQGKYSGGMGKAPAPGETWALLGAIVKTAGMPYFFKLTGPSKTVLAARGELDALVSSLTPKK